MTGPTHGPTGDPRTEAGRRLAASFKGFKAEAAEHDVWSQGDEIVMQGVLRAILAIEQEAAADRDALAARVQVLLDVAAFALGALNDPEVLGEQAKRLLRAALRPDAPEDPA